MADRRLDTCTLEGSEPRDRGSQRLPIRQLAGTKSRDRLQASEKCWGHCAQHEGESVPKTLRSLVVICVLVAVCGVVSDVSVPVFAVRNLDSFR